MDLITDPMICSKIQANDTFIDPPSLSELPTSPHASRKATQGTARLRRTGRLCGP